MNDFVKKERECPDKYYGKIDYVFSKDGAFIFACALAGMGLFIFLRTIVSMFGFVRFEEFYAAYSFIGYGSIATGLVNLFFGGLETLLLGSISVSIFSIIVAVKHENREKSDFGSQTVLLGDDTRHEGKAAVPCRLGEGICLPAV